MTDENQTPMALLDGSLDLGIRSLHLLLAAYPHALSLQDLVNYDYLLIHSDDAEDGPPSLHPPTPLRNGEILAKRNVLQDGIDLMISRGLIEKAYTENGVCYIASEETGSFIDALTTTYHRELEDRANWLAAAFPASNPSIIDDFVQTNIDRWGAELNLAYFGTSGEQREQ